MVDHVVNGLETGPISTDRVIALQVFVSRMVMLVMVRLEADATLFMVKGLSLVCFGTVSGTGDQLVD